MAGLRGGVAYVGAAKQSAKGTLATPAALTTYKSPLSGGNIGPDRNIDQLAETDGSRDQGISFVRSVGASGAPELYVRDDSLGFWLNAALGADAVTGTTNLTHVETPVNNIPYLTVWRMIDSTLFEVYGDVFVNTLTIRAGVGDPLVAIPNLIGRTAGRLTTDPLLAITMNNGPVYSFNDSTMTLAGAVTGRISSFELVIDNSVSQQQTNAINPYDVVAGTRRVSLTFDYVFEDLAEYNRFHYATTTGVAQSSTVSTVAFDALFNRSPSSANNSIEFSMPAMAYDTFPVAPDVGGGPIVASIRAVSQRGASPVVTATVKNQVATY